MYKLTMTVNNIKYASWWWNGKSVYEFETMGELISFMTERIPLKDRDVKLLFDNDSKCKSGRLDCTSWYEVYKGENEMTEYTSF